MAVPTSRTNENAQITLDPVKCTGCGRCVQVCKDFNFVSVLISAITFVI